MADESPTARSLEQAAFRQLLASTRPRGGDEETIAENFTKLLGWILAASEAAATRTGLLLTENRGDERIVRLSHDMLNDLTTIRNGALLARQQLERAQAPSR